MTLTSSKAMTLRLPPDQADELALVAEVDETSVSDEIRTAIAERIEQRRNDPEFQKKLREIASRNQELYERLAST